LCPVVEIYRDVITFVDETEDVYDVKQGEIKTLQFERLKKTYE
jgi:hypothetical protein